MDRNRFDRLVVALSTADTRRGMVRLLGALPFVGGLTILLGEDETFADGRRRRHKKPHKQQKRIGNRAGKQKKQTGKKKHPDKGCKAESHAATCADKCGPVKNTCKKTVDCGSCACDPPCEICHTCQGEPGECLQDAPGTPCGDPGQVCQGDGSCACEATSCPSCTTCGGDGACEVCAGCCDGDQCVANCGACQVCDHGQCTGCPNCCDANGICKPGDTNASCGAGGGTCASCTEQQTCGGGGTAGLCGCTPTTCAAQGKTCGSIPNACGGSIDCGSCPLPGQPCESNVCGTCVPDCTGKVCGNDGCGGICGSCVDQGAATCGTTGACRGGDCELYTSGATCQAATCTGETMLQPACTCDGQGSCNCPGSITCPNDLVCRNGACLTTCGNDNDCDVGTCAPNGTCMPPFICDCSNLNDCSGHGVCTESCICLCDEGWSGSACTDQPFTLCGDYPTCDTCTTHLLEGCTWCLSTLDGEVDVCTRGDVCSEPLETCPAGG